MDWRDLDVQRLSDMILHTPQAFLFRLIQDLPNVAGTHPKTADRILFLIKNQSS